MTFVEAVWEEFQRQALTTIKREERLLYLIAGRRTGKTLMADEQQHWFDDEDDVDEDPYERCYDCGGHFIEQCTCYCPDCREPWNGTSTCLCYIPEHLRLPSGV